MAKSAAELFDVSGWIVVGTGCGTGLGLHMAQSLAASGARVYIASRRRDVLDRVVANQPKDSKGELIALTLDHSDKESIKAAVAEVSKREKYIDMFLANAAVAIPSLATPIQESDSDPQAISDNLFSQDINQWDKLLRINLTGVYFSSVAFMPLLAANPHKERASIITVGSISGTTKISQGGQYAYNAAKAAVHSLTQMLANDFQHKSIRVRVNCIAPGFFPSEMTVVGEDAEAWKQLKRIRERLGEPDDIVSTMYSLATNKYINGVILHVDGGWLLDVP